MLMQESLFVYRYLWMAKSHNAGPLVYTDSYKHTYYSRFKAVNLECVDYYIHSESRTCRSTDLKIPKDIIIAYRAVFTHLMYKFSLTVYSSWSGLGEVCCCFTTQYIVSK